jgi:hypothetical protein
MSNKASTKNVFMVNCHASIKGLFTGMILFAGTVISIILYAVFRNKIGDDVHIVPSYMVLPNKVHHDSRLPSIVNISHAEQIDQYQWAYILPSSLPAGHGPFTSISDTPKRLIYSIAIIEIVNLCLLLTSLLATTWALIKIRKLQYRRTTTRRT